MVDLNGMQSALMRAHYVNVTVHLYKCTSTVHLFFECVITFRGGVSTVFYSGMLSDADCPVSGPETALSVCC